jgi:hypothetical protein
MKEGDCGRGYIKLMPSVHRWNFLKVEKITSSRGRGTAVPLPGKVAVGLLSRTVASSGENEVPKPVIASRPHRHCLPAVILSLSILLHLVLLFTVSGWIIIRPTGTIAPTVVTLEEQSPPPVDQPALDLPEDSVLFQADTAGPVLSAAAALPEVIVSVAPQPFNLPPVSIPGVDLMSPARELPPGAGEPVSQPAAAVGPVTATLFGTPVTAGRLGVIIDVSLSIQPYLPCVVDEIEHNFKDALIVMVSGCGMFDTQQKARVLPYNNSAQLDPRRGPELRRNPLQMIKIAEREHPELIPLFKYLRQRPNIWYVYGGDIGGAQFAFRHLLDRNVDTIYWFADFADAIDPGWAATIQHEVTAAGIKLIPHNFVGDLKKRGVPYAQALARRTGGQLILTKPAR